MDQTRLRIVQGVTGDALTIAPAATLTLDAISISLGPVSASLERYAARVAALHPRLAVHHAPLGGWGSWNIYYDEPTADLLRQDGQLCI